MLAADTPLILRAALMMLMPCALITLIALMLMPARAFITAAERCHV